MFWQAIQEALTFIGGMVLLVAVIGILLNLALYRNWYGETEAQRRERVRRERGR